MLLESREYTTHSFISLVEERKALKHRGKHRKQNQTLHLQHFRITGSTISTWRAVRGVPVRSTRVQA